MAIGHIVGQFSESFSKAFCLNRISNEFICSGFAVGVHEFLIEPATDLMFYESLGQSVLNKSNLFGHFDLYNLAAKFAGSYILSNVAEKFINEPTDISTAAGATSVNIKLVAISSISGAAGSFLTDYLYHTDFTGSLARCRLEDPCFDELTLSPMVRSVTGSYLSDSAYHHLASNHTSSEI